MPPITLPKDFGTRELRLRPAVEQDATAVHAACQDPEIQKWTRVPSPYALEDAYTFVELSRSALADGTGAHLVVVGADDGRLRGAVGVGLDWRDRTGEVGYWVAPDVRRQRIATSATGRLCRFAFEDLGIAKLHLMASIDNPASTGVAERLGFKVEGVLRSAMTIGPSGEPDAPRGDARIYGVLPDELRAPA